MKIFEIKEMNSDELKKRIIEDEKELVDLRFQHELKNLTNTAKLKNIRRDIAKMKTVLKIRSMEEQNKSLGK